MDDTELSPRAAAFPPAGRRFFKYDALGNDYIVLDPADWPEPPAAAVIRRICDRHRGVGSDGILWGPTSPTTPLLRAEGRMMGAFALRLFNPDGGEFEKSGNGLRIFARYLWDRGLPSGPEFDILTPGGTVTAHVLDAEGAHIAMDMGRLSFLSTDIGIAGPAREVVGEEVIVAGLRLRIVGATIGNPHCVVFLDAQTPEVQAELRRADRGAGASARSRPGAPAPLPQPHERPIRPGDRFAHRAHRNLGTRRRVHARFGHIVLRGHGRGHPHRPLRQPRHRADARRRDARRGRAGLVGALTGTVEFVCSGEVVCVKRET